MINLISADKGLKKRWHFPWFQVMENHDYDDEKATGFWIKIPVGASNKNPEINKRSKKETHSLVFVLDCPSG